MITALCFINTDPHAISEAGDSIAQLPGVRSVYSVTGKIDLVAIIEVNTPDQVAGVVADSIGKVPGVTTTETHIAFRTYDKRDLDAGFALGN
ncbi:MAG: Lrp/AsnC ligand binding domain-containing protein [Candidatus Nanopelagicales bacterium]|nr:Lrp/AsnC ligand binding domain-containing protein [Candidatus Nanopelagicales bacterium]MCF8551892.1 Lrp/AsnC ligand binding domain-containing protein [Candidatus Nanopelagicales bacterium]